MPIGADRVALMSAGGVNENYFGDGTDGAFSSSGDTALTPTNISGDWDADMIVKNYTSFTLNAGHDFYINNPCRGLLFYVTGNVSIAGQFGFQETWDRGYNNQFGGEANPESAGGSDSSAVSATGIRLPMFTASGTDTLAAADFAGCGTAAVSAVANHPGISGNGTIFGVVRKGALGSPGGSGTPAQAPSGSVSGGMGQTGGGGGGAGSGTGGAGSYGHCWGAGSGGGGGSPGPGGDAGIWGGAGGGSSGTITTGGGGNPGGGPAVGPCYGGQAQVAAPYIGMAGACGGTVIWVVGGDFTITADSSPPAGFALNGGNGSEIRTYYPGCGTGNGAQKCTGGGTGGGCLIILHKGTYTNNGTINVAGGNGGMPSNLAPKTWGGQGGNGTSIIQQVL